MANRNSSLQVRLSNIETRLRAMRTVTNTASSEVAGGETIIDTDGTLIFSDGGRLRIGGSSVRSSSGNYIIDPDGNLSVDSLEVHGDILSSKDYLFQREVLNPIALSQTNIENAEHEISLDFPDWSSRATITVNVKVDTRFQELDANPIVFTINGKVFMRPKTSLTGDVIAEASVVRRILPEQPVIRLGVGVSGEIAPTQGEGITIEMSGVYTV